MCVKQISVSLDNVPGRLLDVSEHLGAEGINIRAVSYTHLRAHET